MAEAVHKVTQVIVPHRLHTQAKAEGRSCRGRAPRCSAENMTKLKAANITARLTVLRQLCIDEARCQGCDPEA